MLKGNGDPVGTTMSVIVGGQRPVVHPAVAQPYGGHFGQPFTGNYGAFGMPYGGPGQGRAGRLRASLILKWLAFFSGRSPLDSVCVFDGVC